MTNLEAIKAKVNYPLSDDAYKVALLGRGLIYTDEYTNRRAMDLAQADLIYTVITSPNITEGGYSVSFTSRTALLKVANAIYSRYGVRNPSTATAKFVSKI